MKYDVYGIPYCTSTELSDLLYKNPELDIGNFLVVDPEQFNESVRKTYTDFPELTRYVESESRFNSIEQFDAFNQSNWYMPNEYKSLDIAQWVLNACTTEAELQRVGEELLLYQEFNLLDLLRFLKYFVDTMRANNIVWGLGRGSSVASYVLYLIGVHKVNSMYYDLKIEEFLR